MTASNLHDDVYATPCPTCRTSPEHIYWTCDLSVWAGVLHRRDGRAAFCAACERPWLRWRTGHPDWRGGHGPRLAAPCPQRDDGRRVYSPTLPEGVTP